MNIDGRAIAEDLYSELAARRAGIDGPVRLGIVVGGSDPVIESFIRIKARAAKQLDVEIVRKNVSAKAGTAEVIEAIRFLATHSDGMIVQLPLPDSVDLNAVLSEVPAEQDVDSISPRHSRVHRVDAPVARAVGEILDRSNVNAAGKSAVVIGAGRLVGAPVAGLLKHRGASVTVVTEGGGSMDDLKNADIVVSGAGEPGLVKPEMLKKDVVLIDAGTSESSGRVVGDAEPECADVASVFTPVPGGVGPIAVAMIFKNLFDLVELRT